MFTVSLGIQRADAVKVIQRALQSIKWLKTVAGDTTTIHGFRHSFRDRLREVEAPNELIDQLGGWSLQSVGQSYGIGYPLKITSKWMSMIVLR